MIFIIRSPLKVLARHSYEKVKVMGKTLLEKNAFEVWYCIDKQFPPIHEPDFNESLSRLNNDWIFNLSYRKNFI